MKKLVTLASWITNKVWEWEYFLFLDYDLEKEKYHKIEEEISSLINTFNLSTADIYGTHSGFHVYFFFDNSLSKEDIVSILDKSELIDQKFKDAFDFFSKDWKWATLRLNGKHKKRDIYFYWKIKWREPNYIEKSVWDSLKMLVESQISDPFINLKSYQYEYEIDWNIKRDISNSDLEKSIPEVNKEPQNKIDKIDVNKNKETIKLSPEELFPKNSEITKERQLWYQWPYKNIIARLISASVENRECAFIENRDVSLALNILNNFISYDDKTDKFLYHDFLTKKASSRKIDDEGIKNNLLKLTKYNNKKYKIDQFVRRRPFFMNNSVIQNIMMKSFDYSIEKSWILDTPLHFFKSVASLDTCNHVLSEKIKTTSIYNFNSDEWWKTSINNIARWMRENKLDILDSFDLIYDFDTKNWDSTESYDECRKMRDLLNSKQIPFSLNFSWSKWFHIRIPGKLINKATPELSKYLKKDENNIKHIFESLMEYAYSNNIKIDEGVYSWDVRCLIRTEWSIHQSTGSVVKPLTDKEFDELKGNTLFQIQELFKPSNLLKWKKLNVQKKDIIIRVDLWDWIFNSWEEMRDSWYDYEKWWEIRSKIQNPLAKELRSFANGNSEDIKKFNKIIEKWEYKWYKVEAPWYIDLMTWRNYDFCRQWDLDNLKEFVLELIN